MKSAVFWDIIANVVPSSLIRFIPMMETIRSSETSILRGAIQHDIPEEGILLKYI
jgi:hypothetical protein